MSQSIRRILVDERLVRSTAEADRVVSGWLLNATSSRWEEDFVRLAKMVGGDKKAEKIVNRLCEVIR